MSLRNIFELRKASICHSHAGGNPESASNTLIPAFPPSLRASDGQSTGMTERGVNSYFFVRVFLCALTNFRI